MGGEMVAWTEDLVASGELRPSSAGVGLPP